ncbi:MAG TPA: glycosyl hydrolase 108 family protein [Candidatus Krumholzibacteria bacterium]|nr:glycosyl hydrolase 108 family protein [Candidatus Krumholzibacteria bacterium]
MFTLAIDTVLAHEGDEFTDIPEDRGGPTKYGIASRWHPEVDLKTLTREQAIEIYWTDHWAGHRYETLPAPIAIKVFDLAVNLGHRAVVKCLQRALRACGEMVEVDGLLGRETARAAALVDQTVLVAALRSEAAGEYRVLAAKNQDQAVFLNGWLNRAYS